MASCSVYGCTSRNTRKSKGQLEYEKSSGEKIRLYRFPENLELRKCWVKEMGRENWKPKHSSRLCSRHFHKSCFEPLATQVRLLPGSIPTIFPSFPLRLQKDKNMEESELLIAPFEGQIFPSFDSLRDYLKIYGNENNMRFWVRSSLKLKNDSKISKYCNPSLKYKSMKLACIYGGEKTRQRGYGIRKCSSYRNLGCPCKILASVDNDGNHVRLDCVNLQHNHELLVHKRGKTNDSPLQEVSKNLNLALINDNDNENGPELRNENIDEEPENHCLNEETLLKNENSLSKNGLDVNNADILPEKICKTDLTNLCRLCLHMSEDLAPIFYDTSTTESTILSLKIMGCASISLEPNDNLPNFICKSCEETLEVAYNFRLQCENSDTLLREIITMEKTDDSAYIEKKYEKEEFLEERLNEEEDTLVVEKEVKVEIDLNEDKAENCNDNNIQLTNHYYKCLICDFNLSTLNHCLEHVKLHNVFHIRCEMCLKVYDSSDCLYNVVDHVLPELITSQMEDFRCSSDNHDIVTCGVCDKWCQWIFDLESDEVTETVEEVDDTKRNNHYLCTTCGKVLKTKARFVSHRNTHQGLKPHVCFLCGKGFADRKNLQQHSDQVHLKKANHECPICKKMFYVPSKLKSHMTVHFDYKPFSCSYCNKTFRLKMNMIKHIKTHTNTKPYKCDKCPAAFIDRNMLTRHSYVHGGVRPFCCHLCGQRFPVKFRLKKHLEKNNCRSTTIDEVDEVDTNWLEQNVEIVHMFVKDNEDIFNETNLAKQQILVDNST